MPHRHIILILFPVIIALISCNKGGTVEESPHIINTNDTIPPVLEIYTPVEGQSFANGTTISITGKITDEGGLYRGSIRVTNDADGSLVRDQAYEIHGFQLYNFSLNQPVSSTVTSNYSVTVFFEDHGLNTVTKSVHIRVTP